MKVAEIDIAGPVELEMRALDWLYTTWLPRSGYVPDHQPGFEAWNGEPFAHGDAHFELRVQLPVVPAAPDRARAAGAQEAPQRLEKGRRVSDQREVAGALDHHELFPRGLDPRGSRPRPGRSA